MSGAELSRRSAILAAVSALTLSACASPEPPQSPSAKPGAQASGTATPGPATPGPATPGPATPGAATSGSAPSGPESTDLLRVDPQQIIARFEGVRPTQWGLEVPGVVTGLVQPLSAAGTPRVALTFDACGGARGSGYDAQLIDFLVSNGVAATLFLNARWIDANPDTAQKLVQQPLFELGNHGTNHRPLSVTGASAYGIVGTASAAQVVAEVWDNHQKLLALTGKAPRWFRSGTAHYDDVAVQIALALGERVAGFRVNADGGATYPEATVIKELSRVSAGAISIAHVNQPGSATAGGMRHGITALLQQGTEFVHLD